MVPLSLSCLIYTLETIWQTVFWSNLAQYRKTWDLQQRGPEVHSEFNFCFQKLSTCLLLDMYLIFPSLSYLFIPNCVRPGFSCMLSSRSFVAFHFVFVILFEWTFVRVRRSMCGLVGRQSYTLQLPLSLRGLVHKAMRAY